MKILLTCDPEIPVPPGLYGGIERIVDGLIEEYCKLGYDVTLCANPKSKVPCKLIGWKGSRSQKPLDIIQNSWQLTRLVFSQKFDVVHSFSRLAYMTAIMPSSIPKIMSYQREPSVKQIKKAVALSKKGSIAFTGCSHYISDKIQPFAEAHAVYNFVPVDKYDLQTKIEKDAPLVFLGRIEEIKGTHIAVEVAIKTGKRLIIAGNIPADKQSYFDKKVKPFLNDRISYVGKVNDEQKNEILGKALAFLMPIQWNEPFGIVMAEAMACGTPVIGFGTGAVPEVIENNVTGYVCNTIEEMTRKVSLVGSLDRKVIRQSVEVRFNKTEIAKQYLAIYESKIAMRRIKTI